MTIRKIGELSIDIVDQKAVKVLFEKDLPTYINWNAKDAKVLSTKSH